MMIRSFRAAVAGTVALGVLLGSTWAVTPAGAVIFNQSRATYFDPALDRSFSALSNTAVARVIATVRFQLLGEAQIDATPGELVTFSHQLANTGNVADRYRLSVSESELERTAIFLDVNDNGTADPDEPEILETGELAPNETISLLITSQVPNAALTGSEIFSTVRAVSLAQPEEVRERTNQVNIINRTSFRITKDSFPACTVPVPSGEVIAFTLTMLNLDQLRPAVRNVVIDGTDQRGVLIEDMIPANTFLDASLPPVSLLNRSIAVVRPFEALENERISFDQFSGGDIVQSVGVFIPEEQLLDGQSARFSFNVRVIDNITEGTRVLNQVEVDTDGDGRVDTASNITCNELAPSDPSASGARLRFLEPAPDVRTALTRDTASAVASSEVGRASISVQGSAALSTPGADEKFVLARVYQIDSDADYLLPRDGVYLELRSTSLNAEPGPIGAVTRQTALVELTSDTTGDRLLVELEETGLNTGLFRSLRPIRLSLTDAGQGRRCRAVSAEACVIRSSSGDRLTVVSSGSGLEGRLQSSAIVDPTGIVFDAATLEPVQGATVRILDIAGAPARNPDTDEVVVPIQTDVTGRYDIPRLEEGRFFFDVSPPATYSFPSTVPASVFAGRRGVSDASFGRNGEQDIIDSGIFSSDFLDVPGIIDIPIDPDLSQGQLGLEKSADRAAASFGEGIDYTLSLSNDTGAVLLDATVVDTPPAGFRLVEGSVRVDGEDVAVERDGRSLVFALGRLEADEALNLTYRLQIGPEARPGDATNSAVATARSGSGLLASSPTASETVHVSDTGLFSDRAFIIGSIWVDVDRDGVRDATETGVPAVRVWLEDGTWVETDEFGKYSLYGLNPGLRIARIDMTTVPAGLRPHVTSSRQADNGLSRFVDLLDGELHRVEFALECADDRECGESSALPTELERRAERLGQSGAGLGGALGFRGQINGGRGNRIRREGQVGPDGDISSGRTIGFSGGLDTSTTIISDDPEQLFDTPQVAPDPEEAAENLSEVDFEAGAWLWPLADPQTGILMTRDGRIVAGIRAGVAPVLYIDGVAVSEENLGAVIEDASLGAQVAAWYGVEFGAGRHEVEIRGEDPFGNERVLAKTVIVRAGAAARIRVRTGSGTATPDSTKDTELVVHIVDDADIPVPGSHFVTVTAEYTSSGTPVAFLTEDIQPDTPGHQINLRDGVGYLALSSPGTAGEVRIIATDQGGMSGELELNFREPLRDLIAVGVIEVDGRVFDLDGDLEPANPDEFPTSFDVDGRTAVFLKGRIKGDALLTFAYDSDKERDDGLFRDIDPEAYYPIYGDASQSGYEAQSRSKLFVRVERGDSSASWGDFRTDNIGLAELTRLRRSFTGANIRTQIGKWTAQVFGADVRESVRTERIRGRGTALEIVLPGAPIVPNSEVLTVEVLDRNNPGLTIGETPLQRFADFLLDDETGRLTLKAPLPSVDEDGNPIFLRATYEVRGEIGGEVFAGLRVDRESENSSLNVGVNYDESADGVDRAITASAGVRQRIGAAEVFAEAGHMDTRTDTGASSTGEAYRAGVAAPVLGGSLVGEYAQADDGFNNPDAPIRAGRREARLDYQHSVGSSGNARIGSTYSEDLETGNSRTTVRGLGEFGLGKWRLSAGPRYTIDDTNGASNEFASVVGRVDRQFSIRGRTASSHVEVEQNLSDSGTRVSLGTDVALREDTRLYVTHRLLDDLPDQTFAPGITGSQGGSTTGRTLVGLETNILPGTRAFGEWRRAGLVGPNTSEAVYGIRADWELFDGISVSPQFESVKSFSDGDDPEAQDTSSTALSFGLADRRSPDAIRTARIESRFAARSDFYGLRTGWAQKFTPTLTGAVRFDSTLESVEGGDNRSRTEATIGLARRPNTSNKTDIISLYQFLREDNGGLPRNAHIIAINANRRFGRRWTSSGRFASKWQSLGGDNLSAQLFGGRVIREFGTRWDIETRGAWRSVGFVDASEYSAGMAVSWKPQKNTRLTLGYNFAGFRDEDLDPNGYDAKGVYWRLAIAVDESWFGWLRPSS